MIVVAGPPHRDPDADFAAAMTRYLATKGARKYLRKAWAAKRPTRSSSLNPEGTSP